MATIYLKYKIMKKLLTILSLTISASYSFAQTTTWKDDPMHTKLTFTVTHIGISSVFGLFQKFDVAITSSKPDFSDAMFELSADVASINTEVKMRDDNLRSSEFFNVAKYPNMTFKSTSIVNTTGMKDRFRVTGNLTIHGVTKSVAMDLWFRGTTVDAISKKTKAGFQLIGVIKRTDFGVGAADPFDVSTDVMINADGEFLKQ
jgi:polyisoprenoid-binding protein YceI